MEIVNYSEARANLNAVMDRCVNDHLVIAIARQRGKPVVMISLDDWNAMEETHYLLSTQNDARRLLDSIANIEAGKGLIQVDPETMEPI
jgi:antitoxin YefM